MFCQKKLLHLTSVHSTKGVFPLLSWMLHSLWNHFFDLFSWHRNWTAPAICQIPLATLLLYTQKKSSNFDTIFLHAKNPLGRKSDHPMSRTDEKFIFHARTIFMTKDTLFSIFRVVKVAWRSFLLRIIQQAKIGYYSLEMMGRARARWCFWNSPTFSSCKAFMPMTSITQNLDSWQWYSKMGQYQRTTTDLR